MEIDVLVRAPAAFARAAGLSTPMLDLMAGLAISESAEQGIVSEVSSVGLVLPLPALSRAEA